jgi:plasmid stabilization system protein ParE
VTYRVQLTAEARRQLVEIGEWWMENRRKAPDLVLRELARATSLLSVTPRAGKAYRRSSSVSYRRLLLRRSRFHVYYVIDEATQVVSIVAIWNAVRGHGPELP